jgi:putative SOS response-associated peptidase YedK
MMKWGLIPHWAKDDKLQYSTFNERAEEFTTKPAFRASWKRGQRCLVVTDGFYEWKKLGANGKLKQPNGDGRSVGEMEIANERRRSLELHDFDLRAEQSDGLTTQPVILAEYDWPQWLGEVPASDQELLALLKPCPDEALKIWPVDRMVGNVRNNGPQLILPVLSNAVPA